MKSPTWRALAPLAFRRLKVADIQELRQKAQIKCSAPWKATPCHPLRSPCLFNLKHDPCEENNLAERFPRIVKEMAERVQVFEGSALPPRNAPQDPMSNPALWNDVWVSWLDELQMPKLVCLKIWITSYTEYFTVGSMKFDNAMKEVSALIILLAGNLDEFLARYELEEALENAITPDAGH
uniref:Uncharacterized protein n=1 Tax=Lutzomyia longipalpis TaxID=7200 RepID=A0A1B0CEX0_LUTLO